MIYILIWRVKRIMNSENTNSIDIEKVPGYDEIMRLLKKEEFKNIDKKLIKTMLGYMQKFDEDRITEQQLKNNIIASIEKYSQSNPTLFEEE